MAAIPVNLRAVDPAQSILEKPSTAKILGHAATIDTTSSCEFGVGPHISGVELVCVSQAGSSPSFTIGIDGWDEGDLTWENLVTSAAIVGAATTIVKVNPHIVAGANLSATRLVRRRMRATVTYTSGTATGSLTLHAA